MNSNIQQQFMYLFERVGEPLYFGPRGQNNMYYNVPTNNLDSKTQHAVVEFRKSVPGTGPSIAVKPPTQRPTSALQAISAACPKTMLFSYFHPNHLNAAGQLREIFMNQRSIDDFMAMACECRDSEMVNPRLWIFAFASALLRRQDLKGFRMPAFWEILPDQFVSPDVIRMAQRQAILPEQDRSMIVIDRNFTSDDSNPENQLAYFREDLGINSHHWHWHLIYTLDNPRGERDRKGELFYFMHHDMLARYDAERLCNGLARTVRLELVDPIREGYFSKLYNTNAGIIWGTRQEGTRLQSADRRADARSPFEIKMEDMMTWRNRISEAIDTGMVMGEDNKPIPLTVEKGIDILGDIVEASSLSPNRQVYGNFHNFGHLLIAFSHDPRYRHRENMGVMGDNSTAMRDPVFYRWHKYIDEIFDKYKGTIPPYTTGELTFPGVQVNEISVQTGQRERNILVTHWMQSDIDLSRGLDFGRTSVNNLGPIWARATHLNNEDFVYTINVTNSSSGPVTGMFRIFLAPRLNERRARFDMIQQRLLFFELDKFTKALQPGNNAVTRRSIDSSVTIPWEQSFRDLEREIEAPAANQSICGCGWPQHMLIPKGNASGVIFDVYVIVTDGAKDLIQRKNPQSQAQRQGCRDAASYCGILDERYPDARAMGFPFDRHPRLVNNTPIANLDAFTVDVPNSKSVQVRIVHRDVTFIREGGAPSGMTQTMVGSRPSSPTRPSSPQPQPQPLRPSPNTGGRPGSPPPRGRPGSPQHGGRPRPGTPPSPGGRGNNQGWTWPGAQPQFPQPSTQPGWGQRNPQWPPRSPSPPGWTNIPSPPAPGWRG